MRFSTKQLKRKRVRARITGVSTRPRLSVYVSNREIIAQLIDDTTSQTIAYTTSHRQKELTGATMTKKAEWVGEAIAKQAKSKKIETVVFDRGTHIYHGRIKALAESARHNGLKF